MNDVVKIFKALGDDTRLKILLILSRNNVCAKGIAKHLEISEAAVSQHIKVLKEAGLIIGEKIGYYVHYNLQEPMLLETAKFIGQINNNDTQGIFDFDIDTKRECETQCKSSKNKCCEKNKENQ